MSRLYTDSRSGGITIPINGDAILRWLITSFVIGVMILAVFKLTPPRSAGVEAPLSEFSAARALKDVELIATGPRPIGSSAHEDVRAALLRRLSDLGLDPQTQRSVAVNRLRNNVIYAGTVENVVARLKGKEAKDALMLAAHYDSVPTGPGASDDAAGVATLLETARALKAGPPLRNDVIFLFTDGEETGLLGARAFVNEHPWAKDVKLAINFEARGNSGPSIMFETSPGNRALISGFGKAVSVMTASSLTYDIYRLLPNDTDFSVFKDAKIAGLNLAFIDGVTHYHSSLDTPDQVDERSLQHHGDQALALSRYFGDRDLAVPKTSDAVYFEILGRVLIRYPIALVLPLSILGALLFAATIYIGRKRTSVMKWSGLLRAIGVIFLTLIVTPLATLMVWWLVTWAQGRRDGGLPEMRYHSGWYLLGVVVIALSVHMALVARFGRKIEVRTLAAGAAFWWVIASLLSSLFLPGGSYLFLWPLLFSLAGLYLSLGRHEWRSGVLKTAIVSVITALPLALLWPPITYLIFSAVGFDSVALVPLITALVAGLLSLSLPSIVAPRGWRDAGMVALIGVGLLIFSLSVTSPDPSHPKPDHLFYALNAMTGKAVWASGDQRPDEWTSQYLGRSVERLRLTEYLPGRAETYLTGQAPDVSLPAPQLSLLGEERQEGGRTLKLSARSMRNAPVMSLVLEPGVVVEAAAINGKEVDLRNKPSGDNVGQPWRLSYYALPPEGIDLTFQVKKSGPVNIYVTDQSYGLPEVPGADYKPRAPNLMPSNRQPFSDQLLVNKMFTF